VSKHFALAPLSGWGCRSVVDRMIRIHEVPGSIPGVSNFFLPKFLRTLRFIQMPVPSGNSKGESVFEELPWLRLGSFKRRLCCQSESQEALRARGQGPARPGGIGIMPQAAICLTGLLGEERRSAFVTPACRAARMCKCRCRARRSTRSRRRSCPEGSSWLGECPSVSVPL
jgi:hypothetical protein